ncbi:dephospho-CoA kinase [Caldicoprobacter guelmensis]|uniref:dephospho-CoA kinase n=1 Tax=Caldicoprobacter guelmensis TaxID=1170224 RepID=UPI00195915D0|nr:dephospho-CoA kinase [Caldicoprobacter guelmensis]MBM7582192.1 dephospho-CoA kinase [Caldicoprobacter guelmensis]
MKIIGLTGGIACGKSTVSKILAELGAAVIDADMIAREVMRKGTPVWQEVKETFGDEYLQPDGEIDRKKLGELVFSNPEALKKLNSITHPAIQKRVLSEIERLKLMSCYKAVVVDAALLIEAGWYDMVDEVWLVVADREAQIERLMKRSGLTRQQALNRINSQMAQEIKMRYADKIIDNSDGLEYTRKQVEQLWAEL